MALNQIERVLPTLNQDGSRRWIDPKLSKGSLWKKRRVVAWLLIGLFVGLPFVRIDGRPALLLDVLKREFVVFGAVFRATDTVFLMLLLLVVFVAIFLVSALLGRVWCGWGCPQTVYMEFVFRPIDRLFDKLFGKRTKGGATFAKHGFKNALFALLSVGLANIFLSYFVGSDNVLEWMFGSPLEHPIGFTVVVVTAALIFLDFAYFREQMCTVACPYARLQSALVDEHSYTIGYAWRRGERRGKGAVKEIKKTTAASQRQFGDCIDCRACVITCPTGIDIRDGSQLECVQCGQCVDACDRVMDGLGIARGLIGFGSDAARATQPHAPYGNGSKTKWVRPIVVVYGVAFLVLMTALTATLSRRAVTEVTVLRTTGAPFSRVGDDLLNPFRVRIANRQKHEATYMLVLEEADLELIAPINPVTVRPGVDVTANLFVKFAADTLQRGEREVTLMLQAEASTVRQRLRLLGPKRGD